MSKKKPMVKTIAFRVEIELFQAVEDLAKSLGWTVSDVLRLELIKSIEPKNYWESIAETLRATGLPENEIQRAVKLLKDKKQRQKYVKTERS